MNWKMSYGYAGSEDATLVSHAALETRFTALQYSKDAAYWVDCVLNIAPENAYIMIPACAYDGNRFEAVPRKYPPMFLESELGKDVPFRMTEVPRLSPAGPSLMEVTTGDMAAPCVCVLDRMTQEAFMLFFEQGAHGLNHGVTLEQDTDCLKIRLRAPAKRGLVYRWYDGVPSLRELPEADAPLCVSAGEQTAIAHRVFTFPCADIPALYRAFFEKRDLLFRAESHANLPFSAFHDLVENQLNAHHFVEPEGFYSLSAQDGRDRSPFGLWQAGWVGGGMNTMSLICDGNALSRQRAIRTLEFASRVQSKAGFFYGMYANGRVMHDSFEQLDEKYHLLLIRKHADLTYFLFKQIAILKYLGEAVPDAVYKSAVRAADALVKLWQDNGQLGQFINAETGEIVVGGSTSGAITPAALCAAAKITGDDRYIAYAQEIGQFYYCTATLQGVTTGGPGEILQAPDSESAAALLESFMALYESTGQRKWLDCALDAAHQVVSWVVPYDYQFPKNSRFDKMGIHAAGSVWANVQNKHSAPGLCTLSPSAFLKLYRATGDERYLEVMRQISHFMPQVASYPERPMTTINGSDLKPGEMCERVNLSDWEGTANVGDSIFGASSWPTASLMITRMEIPGVYAVASRGIVCTPDHVNAWMEEKMLCIQNPTPFPAKVKAMIDDEDTLSHCLGLIWQSSFQTVYVPPLETVVIHLAQTIRPEM